MQNEDIKDILTKVIDRQSISMGEITSLIEEYIFDVKKQRVKINIYGAYSIDLIDHVLSFAIEYFKVKFGATLLYNVNKVLIGINYSA